MEFVDEVPMANEVTHVDTMERRDDVLILPVKAALLLRRHWAAEIGWCDKDILEVECMELVALFDNGQCAALLADGGLELLATSAVGSVNSWSGRRH